jgi:sugar (pentulose or hexulose) kinase
MTTRPETAFLLGIDAGTTTIKAVAMSPDGTELARSARPNPVERPSPSRARQDMTTTWSRTAAVVADVVDTLDDGASVRAVGVTGQGGGCWLVGQEGPARAAIPWTDSRAAPLVEDWAADGTARALFDRFGYGVFPGQALPLVCWLAEHDPASLDRADALVGAKDWLKYRLTGRLASDPTAMSLAHWDPVAGEFAATLPEGVPVAAGTLSALEPPVQSPTDVVGRVTAAAAAETGLPEGTPVAAGTFDVAATAVGSGAVGPAATSVVAGTTLQIQRVVDPVRIEPPAAGYTLDLGFSGRGLRTMGAMTGTPNLDWARETLADDAPFETVEAAAADLPPGAGGVLYLPYLSEAGEKAPFVEPAARAGFVGLDPNHGRDHLCRAVYEGLAMSIRDCAEHVPGHGAPIALSGGGSRSELLCQVFADALDTEVVVPTGDELGALGAATMAGVAVGVYDDLAGAAAETLTVARAYEPRPGPAAFYDDWYGVYTATRDSLLEAWRRRAAVLADHEWG